MACVNNQYFESREMQLNCIYRTKMVLISPRFHCAFLHSSICDTSVHMVCQHITLNGKVC